MEEVYRAHDTTLNRDVAIKALPAGFAHDRDRLAGFKREAESLATLNHPNVAQVFGFETVGETRAIVMELVPGRTLASHIAEGPLPIDDVLAIAGADGVDRAIGRTGMTASARFGIVNLPMMPRQAARVAMVLLALCLTAVRASGQVLSEADTARLRVYYEAIGPAVQRLPARASVADLLRPLFQLAASHSADRPPATENRAALLALALYVNGRDPARLIPDAREWRRPAWRRLQLGGRGDLAQHFTISAAIAAAAGAPIAHLIGLYKEVDDARRGGGFSFSDLTADRAGTTFGESATASAESARRLQSRVTGALVDADIMPPVDGLPPDLSEREFTRRYRGANEAAFRTVLAEIDRRIAELAIFGV